MSELNIPESWAEAKFGSIFSAQKGKKPNKLYTDYTKGLIPYVDIRAFTEKKGVQFAEPEESRIVEKDDIVIVWDGSRSGLVGKAIYGALGSTLGRFPQNDLINNDYLFHFLSSKYQFLNDNKKGAGIPHLNTDLLYDLILPIPALLEQKRIVQKIESTLSRIIATETNLIKVENLLQKYQESLLAKAFKGELTKQNSKDNTVKNRIDNIRDERKEKTLGKYHVIDPVDEEDKLFEIPLSWEWVRLGEVCSLITDGVHAKPKYTESGVAFISVKDVTTGQLDFSDCKFVSKKDHETFTKRCKPERGDVLYTKVGATYGRPAIVDTDREFSLYVSVALLKPIQSLIDSKYLHSFLRGFFGKSQADRAISGIGVPDLHLTKIRNFVIPLPPIEEQKRIVAIYERNYEPFQGVIKTIQSAEKLTQKMKESVLRKAFEGRLVEQNSLEGTGQELLAKILSTRDIAQNPISINKSKKTTKKAIAKKTVTAKGKKNGKK